MDLFGFSCPLCGNAEVHAHHTYETQNHGIRTIYHCRACDIYFSETFATPLAGLSTSLSRIIEILKALSEGLGLNVTAQTFRVSKKSVIDWERHLARLWSQLLCYAA